MSRFICLLILGFLLTLGGCADVIYDDYIDSFQYKPEGSGSDYFNRLGPNHAPLVPTELTAE